MKIPNKLKGIGLDWNVKLDEALCVEHSAHGCTDRGSQTIYLNPRNSPQMMQQTFFHELMHAAWWSMGLTTTYNLKQEEHIVNSLSVGMHQLLRDNGLLR